VYAILQALFRLHADYSTIITRIHQQVDRNEKRVETLVRRSPHPIDTGAFEMPLGSGLPAPQYPSFSGLDEGLTFSMGQCPIGTKIAMSFVAGPEVGSGGYPMYRRGDNYYQQKLYPT